MKAILITAVLVVAFHSFGIATFTKSQIDQLIGAVQGDQLPAAIQKYRPNATAEQCKKLADQIRPTLNRTLPHSLKKLGKGEDPGNIIEQIFGIAFQPIKNLFSGTSLKGIFDDTFEGILGVGGDLLSSVEDVVGGAIQQALNEIGQWMDTLHRNCLVLSFVTYSTHYFIST